MVSRKATVLNKHGLHLRAVSAIVETSMKFKSQITLTKGRGKRVTLRNKSDELLADFIIGKEVPDRQDQRFVRVPGQKRTYGVNVKVDLSTRFADWIETNLLKVDTGRVRKLVFDNHKVIPEEQRVERQHQVQIDSGEPHGH